MFQKYRFEDLKGGHYRLIKAFKSIIIFQLNIPIIEALIFDPDEGVLMYTRINFLFCFWEHYYIVCLSNVHHYRGYKNSVNGFLCRTHHSGVLNTSHLIAFDGKFLTSEDT